MAELKNLIVNGVARVNGDLYVSDNIYGTASNAISASWAPMPSVSDTDRYVNTASFASTGSNGANGVKMTLTRAGSDTGTVVATIPVASTTAAGVMTGAQVTNLNGAVASGSLAKNVTAITASLIASGALAKTAIQPAATASWKAASDWITANSASALTNTDRYVNTAAFASTGSAGANGVKMTLTRAGSDTATVVATIPVVSATAAGVVTGTQFKKWETGSNWVGANSASLATAITNNHTHTNKAVLDGITAAKTASWDGVASTASAAYTSASQALATASVAKGYAESASTYASQAQAARDSASSYVSTAGGYAQSARNWSLTAENYAEEASGSMEDARFYSAQAATNATLASTYAIQASASANIISASTVDAQRYATNASASASLLYKNIGSATVPVYLKTTGPVTCSGTVITAAERLAWNTASIRASASYYGDTIPFSASNSSNNLKAGYFYNLGSFNSSLPDDGASITFDNVNMPSDRAWIWGGIFEILRDDFTVFFNAEDIVTGIKVSDNSVEALGIGKYEFNAICPAGEGYIYVTIVKYSN